MITFAVEPWEMYSKDAAPLWPEHFKELAVDQDKIDLDVDVDKYAELDKAGILFIVVGRVSGEIVAYWIGFIRGHLHYQGTLHAFNDIYYVKPEFRGKGGGSELFNFAEKELRRRGVKRITNATKISHHHGPLFEAHGFKAIETVYSKYLED
jgi:GNAT superfamily N-acetyltransferase